MEKEFTLAFNEVVNDIHDDRTEVTMEAARRYDPNAQYGDMVLVESALSDEGADAWVRRLQALGYL